MGAQGVRQGAEEVWEVGRIEEKEKWQLPQPQGGRLLLMSCEMRVCACEVCHEV